MRILSMDPGTTNFAVAASRIELGDKTRFKLEGTAMLNKKLIHKDMVNCRASLNAFLDYMDPLLQQDFDCFVVERFQARGGKGPTIESINTMLGAMFTRVPHIPNVVCYTAGTWKNAFNLFGDLKEMYEDHKDLRKDKSTSHIQIHELDASLMAFYAAGKVTKTKPFDFITNRDKEYKLLQRLDAAPKLTW